MTLAELKEQLANYEEMIGNEMRITLIQPALIGTHNWEAGEHLSVEKEQGKRLIANGKAVEVLDVYVEDFKRQIAEMETQDAPKAKATEKQIVPKKQKAAK